MIKRYFLLTVLLVATVIIFSGCTIEEEVDQAEEELVTERKVVVTDRKGREVSIEGVPERIVSLSPANTETLFALGLGEAVVAVTEYCNYPPEAQEKELIGDFANPSTEKILELSPDLVLASTLQKDTVLQLEDLGVKVLVVESQSLEEIYSSIKMIAEVTAVEEEGEALVLSMMDRVKAVEDALAVIGEADRVLIFYEVYSDPLMSAGDGTFINEIIAYAGGINIFHDVDENYPMVSAEVVAEKEPDVILYPDYHGTADLVLEQMAGRPGWENVPAITENRIYAVNDDHFSRPGPRIVNAIEEAAKFFYPDLF